MEYVHRAKDPLLATDFEDLRCIFWTTLPSQHRIGVVYEGNNVHRPNNNFKYIKWYIKWSYKGKISNNREIKYQNIEQREGRLFLFDSSWLLVLLCSHDHTLSQSLNWGHTDDPGLLLTSLIRATRTGRSALSWVFLICSLLIWNDSEVLLLK